MMACANQPHSRTAWPAECSPTAPAAAKPVEPADLEGLAGSYAVTFVMLSHGPTPLSWGGRLELTVTDTLQRYYVRTIRGYVKRGFRPLAGRFRYAADTLDRREEAEVEDGVLYIGCRNCADASPNELRLLAQNPGLVWGLWENPQTGIDRVGRAPGDWLPNPAGYFFLRRES
jgi:hypothetical protein